METEYGVLSETSQHSDDNLYQRNGSGDQMAGEHDEEDDIYDFQSDDGGASLDAGEDVLPDMSDSSDDDVQAPVSEEKTGWTDQVRMIHLRRYINQLAEKVQEKDYTVQKTREELHSCRERVTQLEQERDSVYLDIEQSNDDGNVAAMNRLQAQHERVVRELDNEQRLEAEIQNKLDTAEYELAQSQVEQGKYILEEDVLKKREESLAKEKSAAASSRQGKEDSYAEQAAAHRRVEARARKAAEVEEQKRQQHALNEAKRSQKKTSKHLSHTINKMKQSEQEEEQNRQKHVEKRMQSMLALKKDITNNRENLRSLQARDRAQAKQQQKMEERKAQEIIDVGGNATQQLIRERHIEQFEMKKLQHQADQRSHQVEIAGRLLEEEKRMEKRKHQHPQLYTTTAQENNKIVKPLRKKKLQILEEFNEAPPVTPPLRPQVFEGVTGDESDDEVDDLPRRKNIAIHSDSEEDEGPSLAKPEFEGLWDRHKPYNVPKDMEGTLKLPGATKMEKDIMQRVLERHREGIVTQQVAGGKSFAGCPFYSKPDVIHFKDFDVGQTYKKKVTLTNVSYSVNYCKLTGLTEHLRDFIELHFDPPGQMSAGLTCELLVTFKPMINEDLEGEVQFLAQTGPFTIPICCTTKKCLLRVDHSKIDYGTTVIGETLHRSVTLVNEGALGTTFDFYKLTGAKPRTVTSAGTSLGRMTASESMRNVSPVSGEAADKNKAVAENAADKNVIAEPPEAEETGRKESECKDLQEIVGENSAADLKPEEEKADADQLIDTNRTDPMSQDSGLDAEDMEDLICLDGMKVGKISTHEIGPFSEVKLEIVWQPRIPTHADTEFVISFTDPFSESIRLQAVGIAVDVPVWVERETVDLKICMFDRLYQDTVIVNNRATTALRLKFEVCKELRNHMELLPKTGYIQAQSQFSAQLKFLPRKSLFEDAAELFDKKTGVLEAPMIITVADQTRPVPFSVHAVVTSSDLEFDRKDLDFGHCTIHEAVKTTVQLTNKSVLPQPFGFVGIPDFVDVQPNDGFGTLLPLETIELDIIFQPNKARDYNFILTCKSLINREFKLQCQGVCVHPPLQLSKQIVHFKATAVNDVSTTSLHVINNHTSMNEFSHPVPRIGKGEIAPVGPTSFEFVVPDEAPITISPSVGTVEPGQKSHIQIRFTPHIPAAMIRREAVRMVTRQMEQRAREEHEAELAREAELAALALTAQQKKGKDKPKPPSPKGSRKLDASSSIGIKGPAPILPPEEDKILPGSDEYSAAEASLLRQFRTKFKTLVIPCYVASGKCRNPGELPYSVHNTLYLELHCPAVRPDLVVISDSGRSTLDFGQCSIGQTLSKQVTIQNISPKTIDLHSSCLNTSGPFVMLNSLRMLAPDASHTLLMQFTPADGQPFQEVMDINCPTSALHVTLKGQGVNPVVTLSVKDGIMDIGGVIIGEYREEAFKIENTSKLSVQYSITLDSQSLLRHKKAQGLPGFVRRDKSKPTLVGTQNNGGQAVFDCVPAEGVITAGGTKEILVTFAPDHKDDHFSDAVRIELFGQEEQHVFRLVGKAKSHIMYMYGGDPLTPDIRSLTCLPLLEIDEDVKPPPIPILVTLQSVTKDTTYAPATRDIFVGCVRTMAVSQKKNGEWTFENAQSLAGQGFTIEPVKGMIEAGTERPVTITWTPPPGQNPSQPIEESVLCTLRGDVTEVYEILLRGFIVSE